MICDSCKEGGAWLQKGDPQEAAIWHQQCDSTIGGSSWCDCQHVTEPGSVNRKLVPPPAT
jgi:hypothetical protein